MPQPVGLRGVGRLDHLGRARLGAGIGGSRQLIGGGGTGPVRFDEQQRGGGSVQPEVVPVVDGGDRHRVHQLERARLDARGGHGGHGLAGRDDGREEGEHRLLRRRSRPEAQGRLGDDPERPLRADDEMRQRVAGDVLHVLPAGPDDAAIGQDDLQPEHRVARDAVLHAAQPAGVRADVAADRAELVAGRVGRVEEALLGDGGLQLGIDDAGLDDGHEIRAVDLDDPVHARQRDRQRSLDAGRAARQPAPRAARHDGDAMLGGDPHDRGDLLGRQRQRDRQRQPGLEVRGLVAPIRLAVARIDEEPELWSAGAEVVEELGHGIDGTGGVARLGCGA